MAGAALVAARAALHAGAGRVFLALLGMREDGRGSAAMTIDPCHPASRFGSPRTPDFKHPVIVCGCGGGDAARTLLVDVLPCPITLVLDADALNSVAQYVDCQCSLRASHCPWLQQRAKAPLARSSHLPGVSTSDDQADRLEAASQVAERLQAVVMLRGSGTVTTAPDKTGCINSSGNALLATAGIGDVLAGMVGTGLTYRPSAFETACSAVFAHGRLANN
jgi:NAD(P)H-hydrate repair Nnr-like enzyme with NAD(P)H-hydrate dehydratase domain